MPTVSVVVPVYNNEKYVVTCVNSLLAQTLDDIEIICINDGSTDASSQILHDFADRDSRVQVVDKENGGYGVAINRGLDLATGKYFTILESDDFADLDMLETLYSYAERFDLDVVRANFSLYWSKKTKKDTFLELFAPYECDRVIDPSVRENQHCFYAQPALWSALYRTDFLRSNGLRLLETPGAAYQDTAFNFKIWACAKRVMFVHRPFVHYRQDNESSSINDKRKVFNICIEYEEIDRWLNEDRPEKRADLAPVMWKMMCDAYEWNTRRVSEDNKMSFVLRFGQDLRRAIDLGELDESLFIPGQYPRVRKSITDPQGYIDFVMKDIDPDKGLELIFRKARTATEVWRRDGFKSVLSCFKGQIAGGGFERSAVDILDEELATRGVPSFASEPPVNPRISVVLTVYNTGSCLRECLDSIFAQSFKDFEVIAINDGSTDDSLSVLEEYKELDARIRIVSQPNQGASVARNKGIQLASAPYLLILDSDDIFYPEMFSKLLSKADSTGAQLVVCAANELDHESYALAPMRWSLKTELLPKKPVLQIEDIEGVAFEAFMGWPWDRLYSTAFVKEGGFEFPILPNSEDLVFVYDVLVHAESIGVVDEPLVKHRIDREGSISNSRLGNPESFYDAICMLKEKLRVDQDLYLRIEKSFLNWALDYTLWNIASLPAGDVRSRIAARFVSGGFPELEYENHPRSYFDMYPDFVKRIAEVKRLSKSLAK